MALERNRVHAPTYPYEVWLSGWGSLLGQRLPVLCRLTPQLVIVRAGEGFPPVEWKFWRRDGSRVRRDFYGKGGGWEIGREELQRINEAEP